MTERQGPGDRYMDEYLEGLWGGGPGGENEDGEEELDEDGFPVSPDEEEERPQEQPPEDWFNSFFEEGEDD